MNTENTPEKKPGEDAVLNAFSGKTDTDIEFRSRWRATVEQAQQRKKERMLAEAERLKKEEERRLREESSPRVSDEAKPGIPMDLTKLSEAAAAIKRRAALKEEGKTEEEPTPEPEPEPEDFAFDEAAAREALTELGKLTNVSAEMPRVRDRNFKKNILSRTRFFFRTRFSKNGLRTFADKNLPHKGEPTAEITRKCVRAASFVALVCAIVFLGNYFVDFVGRIRTTNEFEDTMDKYENVPEDEIGDAWEQIKAQYPDVDFPEGMNIKFSELYAINQHVVGWLKIDNTKINTVLLQADDNNYHLRMNIYDEYSRFGNPYVHCQCSMGAEGLSKNTILYGHNANDGLMFHDLINYMTVEGYLKSPIVTLDTLYEQTKWKVFAAVLTNCVPSEDNGYVWQYLYPEFRSEDHFRQILDEIDERTIICTGVDVKEDDKIITLYTCCTYQLESGRLAVFARQLREGESEEIDTSRVYYNPNPHYPQAWYTKKNKQNPYADPTEAATSAAKSTTKPSEEKTTAQSGEPAAEETTGAAAEPTAVTDREPSAEVTVTEAPPASEAATQAPGNTAAEEPAASAAQSETSGNAA